MKTTLKEILYEVMNLGMTLRQQQLSGWSGESGNDVLENYLKENEQRISKILENVFEEELKVGDKVTFTTECEEEYDLEELSVGTVLKIIPTKNRKLYNIEVYSDYEENFNSYFTRESLIKL